MASHAKLAGLHGRGLIRFVSFLFIVSLCWHAWVGVRDIWMDYIKPAGISSRCTC